MADLTFLTWPRDEIPASYERITWEDKRERTARDYDPPQSSNGPEMWEGYDPNNLDELQNPEITDEI